ncbi:MAG: 30S ribosomal protein S9 [bacterium]|nr:30S ribosomal protein S9 [bacterium]
MAARTLNAVGRRKSSSARVYLSPVSEGEEATITVNKKPFDEYFPNPTTQMVVVQPLAVADVQGKFSFTVRVNGGGFSGQAGAVRHGIARALEKFNEELRSPLKKAGLLTRDARAVERKKPGRHKARKKPQFSKR